MRCALPRVLMYIVPACFMRRRPTMTSPRFIRAGRTWLVTRRTTRRHFLLRPDADGTTQQIYWYTTAVLARKFGIRVHAVQMLSTHMHEVLTDVRGELPAFVRERNRALANALKRHRHWPEEVFQRGPASYVELYGTTALLREIGYTVANCVEAGLVRSPDKWPGVTVSADDIGRRVVEVERPAMYFDPTNPVWPERASLPIEMPQSMLDTFGEAARATIRRAVSLAVEQARGLSRKAGRAVGSVANLMRIPFATRARSPDGARRGSPTFATGGDAALTKLALTERKIFSTKYRQAVERLGAFVEGAAFPEGSWRWPRELAAIYRASPSVGPTFPADARRVVGRTPSSPA